MDSIALRVDDILVLLVKGCAVDPWPFGGPRERCLLYLDIRRLCQEKTYKIVSSVLRVPTEGVEDGHNHFEDACDVLVGRLLVFDLLKGIVCHCEGSHNVSDYSHFVCSPFPMDCV